MFPRSPAPNTAAGLLLWRCISLDTDWMSHDTDWHGVKIDRRWTDTELSGAAFDSANEACSRRVFLFNLRAPDRAQAASH